MPGRPTVPLGRDERLLVALVVAVLFVDTAFYSAITPLLPYDVRHQGLSSAGAGVLVAGYPAGTFVAAIPAGLIAARRGARMAVLAGVLLTGAASVTFGLSHGLLLLVAARFVEGAAGSASWAGALAWLAVTVPLERRAELIGTGYAAAAGGALLGPALGGLATVVGPAWAFSGAGVSAAALSVAALRLPAPAPEAPVALRTLLAGVRRRRVTAGAVLVGLAGLCFGVLDVLAPLRLGRLGASPVEVAGVFLLAAALETLVGPRVGRIADRRGPRRPLRAASAAAVAVAVLAPTARPAAALAVVVVLGAPAFSALFTPATALVADGADAAGVPQGLAAAGLNLVWSVAAAVAAAGSGLLADRASPLLPYLLVAGCCLACVVALRPRDAGRDGWRGRPVGPPRDGAG